jgi:hypothetical protein
MALKKSGRGRIMKLTRIMTIAAVVVLGLVMSQAAFADTCLTAWNVSQLNDAGASLCYDYTLGVLKVTSFDPGTSGLTDPFINEVGTNGVNWSGATFQTLGGATWSDTGAHNIDGFGSFTDDVAYSPDNPHDYVPFTLASGLTGSISEIVFHVQFGNGCSGFVGGPAGSDSIGSNTNCAGGAVPEPGSLMLFGSGLSTLAMFLRRKFRK